MAKIPCPQCGKTFRGERGLEWHLERIHGRAQPVVAPSLPRREVVTGEIVGQPAGLMEEVAMAEQRPAAGLLMGFLVVEKTAREDGFIAALMVTDNRGYPLEFRATTPVRPSLVQRTLYGKQLEHYVGVELCGKTLLQQSSRKPKAILVPERQLLDIADEVEVDMVAIWRAGEVLKVEEDEAVAAARGTIKPPGSPSQPLVYEGRFTDPDREGETVAYLEDCAGRFDLVEAFERMRAALQLLSKEDPRYA